jgi:hypothetical protein
MLLPVGILLLLSLNPDESFQCGAILRWFHDHELNAIIVNLGSQTLKEMSVSLGRQWKSMIISGRWIRLIAFFATVTCHLQGCVANNKASEQWHGAGLCRVDVAGT